MNSVHSSLRRSNIDSKSLQVCNLPSIDDKRTNENVCKTGAAKRFDIQFSKFSIVLIFPGPDERYPIATRWIDEELAVKALPAGERDTGTMQSVRLWYILTVYYWWWIRLMRSGCTFWGYAHWPQTEWRFPYAFPVCVSPSDIDRTANYVSGTKHSA